MTASASFLLNGASESARVAALDACQALDTSSEPALDNLVALAVRLFRVPCAFIVLVDRQRLYFKSVQGCSDAELPRAGSMGAYLVENGLADPLMVPDASCDARLARDPFVAGEPALRFYAASPLISEGYCLGAFCIGDPLARHVFTQEDVSMLRELAALATAYLTVHGQGVTGKEGPQQAKSLDALTRRPVFQSEQQERDGLAQRRRRLYRLARLDPLTGLADHEAFEDSLAEMAGEQKKFSLILLDIDGFRQLRTSLGREAADLLLSALAHRLRVLFSDARMVARLSGDEFAVILGAPYPARLRQRCRAALDAIADPIEIDGKLVAVGASMGAALYPEHGRGATLLANADLALYEAKKKGTQMFRLFSRHLGDAVIWRKKMEEELRSALLKEQFEIRFQPQVDLASGELVGAEALLRWHHPVRGLVGPADFLNVLETSPSVARVGAWILSHACACAARWRTQGRPDFRIAVNLFPAQVHSGHLQELVMEALASSGLPPDALELEITENTLLRHDMTLIDALFSLRRSGIRIALDDYGTGYASLSLLKQLPVTKLKIDRSFVTNLPQDAEDAAVVQAVMLLGRQFGLGVLAEGIETPEQEAFLRAQGCSEGQGYLYSEALPEADFLTRFVNPAAGGRQAGQ